MFKNLKRVIFKKQLEGRKGCDVSNAFDEEVVGVGEMDFSDDEQEREAKKKSKKKGNKAQELGQLEKKVTGE